MHDFAFIDETLDINLTQSYKLSIQLSLNGLSFCILDTVRDKYIALVHRTINYNQVFDDFLNTIEEILENTELLNKKYKSVKLIWVSSKNTLIPTKFFSEKNLKSHFEFNQKLNDLDEIHYKKVQFLDIYSVYVIPNLLANVLIKKYSGIKFYNQQIPFIETIFSKPNGEERKIFVNVNEDFIDLSILQNNKLILCSNFVYKSEIDIIYFIMNAFNQFQLNINTTEVVFSGFIDKKSQAYIKLFDFIDHIKFAKQSEDFTYSYTFNKIHQSYFINLFNLNHCE